MKINHTHTYTAAAMLALAGVAACSAQAPGGSDSAGDGDGDGDGDSAGDGDSDGGTVDELPDGVETTDLLPARIRRLTNAEYDASVKSLLGTEQEFGTSFPPDARQHGFTMNEAQRVDPILARALDTAAIALAEEAVSGIETLAPCSDPGAGGQACAANFIESFASEAYRRPLTEEDRTGLLALYDAATTGEGLDVEGTPESVYADGISLIIRGVLQSPGFLYVTETGGADPVGSIRMSSHEIASALSYLIVGGPPDAELLAAADAGTLGEAAERESQARRLVATAAGRDRAVEIVSQWLGIDKISVTDKDATVYPDYAGVQAEMAQETADFVRGVLDFDGGAISTFLTGESAVAGPALASVYSAEGPARNGLLNQGAFLSVYAHAHETGPILRGTAVMRKVACVDIELPTTLNVEIVPPLPDPTLTTRERFAVHSADEACRNCHNLIDPIGFVFEQFDGMGAYRTTENGKPVDSSGDVALGKDFDGSYPSSTEFTAALAQSADVAECFARQMYRASAAEAENIKESEQGFVDEWSEIADGRSFEETLVAYAKSESFIYRRNP